MSGAENPRQSDLLDALRVGVCAIDRDGVITYCNPALDALLGYERGELVGQEVRTLTDPEPDRDALAAR